MKKFLIYAMAGDEMCFLHALLNAQQLLESSYEVKIVLEGAACAQPKKMMDAENPLFKELFDNGTIAGVCEACSKGLGVYDENKELGLTFINDMDGHAGIKPYVEKDFEVLVF